MGDLIIILVKVEQDLLVSYFVIIGVFYNGLLEQIMEWFYLNSVGVKCYECCFYVFIYFYSWVEQEGKKFCSVGEMKISWDLVSFDIDGCL